MENREDLKSILGYLPLLLRSLSLFWPPKAVEIFKFLSLGPHISEVDSGELLFVAISDIRRSLNLHTERISPSAADGYALFFDDLMSRAEAAKWFDEVVPVLANLLLRLPSLLEIHYQNADHLRSSDGGRVVLSTGLRLLDCQQPGIVFLSQELIGALLACSFFCLFPINNRGAKHLQMINFDHLFASMYDSYSEKQENKLKCIIHYFERICSCMPVGNVSFERKVLPLEHHAFSMSYPEANFWADSGVSLCPLKVCSAGLIEDQPTDALEVDFANEYIGGGALRRGCVQEEIRFMINPELIASMLFLPSMAYNEAIEIIGAERFSNYAGYASSFQFCGDHEDKRDVDFMGRRKTRIIAIDALYSPGKRQYGPECLLREINKAFCGFFDQCKRQQYERWYQDDGVCRAQPYQDVNGPNSISKSNPLFQEAPFSSCQTNKEIVDEIGIATGNWGCGAFGGDPEIKAIIQWLASSQALRPFILYYTFDLEAMRPLEQVKEWILAHEWSVGELWNMLVEYSSNRLKGETKVGFFNWLLPSLSAHHDPMILDMS